MKGMIKATNKCPQCHSEYPDSEYDHEEDSCHYCLYPEAQKGQATEYSYKDGDPKNRTKDGKLLDELPYIREKQSKQAEDSYNKRKLYKGNDSVQIVVEI